MILRLLPELKTFFDDFDSLSTIDVNNTHKPGFNWYTDSQWPNSSFLDQRPPHKYLPADYSISNSIIALSGAAPCQCLTWGGM